MALEMKLMQHMDFERAEASAERDVVGWRDLLVAEDEHMVVEMRTVEAREIGVVDGPGNVEPDDFGADRRIETSDVELLGKGVARGGFGSDQSGHSSHFRALPWNCQPFVGC